MTDSRPASLRIKLVLALLLGLAQLGSALAQDKGVLTPQALPPLADAAHPATPAKELFGRADKPAPLASASIGSYSKGCLAGAQGLPEQGRHWQTMRPSRQRAWGNPVLIGFVERFATDAAKASGWPGILVGDMSQPRGGPMLTGHASHQIGLDVDIWLKAMPDRTLTIAEREELSSTNVVRADRLDVDPAVWSDGHLAVIRTAASDAQVQRIFVNAAIKRAMCRSAKGQPWMRKVRPWYGHDYHFHVRLFCPKGQQGCEEQEATPEGDGCDDSLDFWFTEEALHPKPPAVPPLLLTLAQLPPECRRVLEAR
jgi:penicillin-insensitive murein endopeptidase